MGSSVIYILLFVFSGVFLASCLGYVVFITYVEKKYKDKDIFKNSKKLLSLKSKFKIVILILAVLCGFIYFYWRFAYSLPINYGWFAILLSVLLIMFELLSFFPKVLTSGNLIKPVYYKTPDIDDDEYPDVDILIPTYSESENLIKKNINSCLHIDYPDFSKVHIYICDDTNRSNIKDLCNKMGVNYIATKNNKDAKPGNINNALKYTSSPYILLLDADMIPKRHILKKLVPHFIQNNKNNESLPSDKQTKLSFVQGPQSFYRPETFQNALNLETRTVDDNCFFFMNEQIGKNSYNDVLYCGTNAVIAREAIESIGGFYTKALTEDFPTGLLIRDKGYHGIAVQDVVAEGVSPFRYDEFILQRIRWTFGNLGAIRQLKHLKKTMTSYQRLSLNVLNFYWHIPLMYFCGLIVPILAALFMTPFVEAPIVDFLIFTCIFYLVKCLFTLIIDDKESMVCVSHLISYSSCFATLAPLFIDLFGIDYKKFSIADKDIDQNLKWKKRFIMGLPHFTVAILSLISIFILIIFVMPSNLLFAIAGIAWLVVNIVFMYLSLKIVWCKKVVETSCISKIQHGAKLSLKDNAILDCVTTKMSESLINICADDLNLGLDDDACLRIKDDNYDVELNVTVVNIDKDTNTISLKIKDIENLEYLALLYNDKSYLQNNKRYINIFGILWNLAKTRFLKNDINAFY